MQITDYSKVRLSKHEQAQIERHMDSWRTVYAITSRMTDTPRNVEILGKMISWEANHNPSGGRAQILTRLHMRLNAMRNRLEFEAVAELATR